MSLFVTTGKVHKAYKEGDVWIESGKTWTIKNGIKRTVNEMDKARKEIQTPLTCPKCGGSMNHHLDVKMWAIHQTCFQCVIDAEHEIIKAGKWEEYQKTKITANADAFVIDMESALKEYVEDSIAQSHVTEKGLVEQWKDSNKGFVESVVEDELIQLKNKVDDYKRNI
jgi:hypothetical protein